jgi:hypothetical protein
VVVVLAVIGVTFWMRAHSEETAVRHRLERLVRELNSTPNDAEPAILRAANIGTFFTDDVVIDFGRGSTPIRGRFTLMEMAARLQSRTTSFALKVADIAVTSIEGNSAEVSVTVEFLDRGGGTQEASLDAREFALVMTKNGDWRIARLNAVDVLR